MTLRRTFDPAFLNEVVNHPEVRPWLGGDRASPIDMTALVTDARNVTLVNEGGGFIFVAHSPNVYEVHTQFLPSGRSGVAEAAREAVGMMFRDFGADVILTDVPEDNGPALGLALKAGFQISGSRYDVGGAFSGTAQRIHELELTKETFAKASQAWRSGTMPETEGVPCL